MATVTSIRPPPAPCLQLESEVPDVKSTAFNTRYPQLLEFVKEHESTTVTLAPMPSS